MKTPILTTIRNAIDAAIANTEDADRIARLELAREYFTNPDFRQALEDHLAAGEGLLTDYATTKLIHYGEPAAADS